MNAVRRLVSWVQLTDVVSGEEVSLSVRHEAEVVDGRRVPLLADPGWTVSGPAGIWDRTTVADIIATARTVVGPDEPRAGWSADQEAAAHLSGLAAQLARHPVVVDFNTLTTLPHDVELSPQLLAQLQNSTEPDEWRAGHDLEVDVVPQQTEGADVPRYHGRYVRSGEENPEDGTDPPPTCMFCFQTARQWVITFTHLGDDPSHGIGRRDGCCAICRALILDGNWAEVAVRHARLFEDNGDARLWLRTVASAEASFDGLQEHSQPPLDGRQLGTRHHP